MKEQYTLLYTIASGFLVAFFVGTDGLEGISLVEIDVADGVIHLVEVFFVVVGCSHSLQLANHLLGIVSCQHLGHGDAGVKLQFVRWIEPDYMLEGSISLLLVAYRCL